MMFRLALSPVVDRIPGLKNLPEELKGKFGF